MAYTTGAQGPQSSVQGPQAWAAGAIWGSQGPVAGKRAPFHTNSANLAITTVSLRIHYTHSQGNKYVIMCDRTISAESDLLDNLPDDIVRMCNVLDFRPAEGYFLTTDGGASLRYKVMETTGFEDPFADAFAAGDANAPVYIADETGM